MKNDKIQLPAGILIVRLGSLGDVANTLPAAQALKESLPDERFGWLVEEPSAELVRLSGVAEQIILFPRRRLSELLRRPWRWPAFCAEILRLRREIRARGYYCALDFQGNLKSGFLSLLSGATDRIGFARGHCREMNWLFNNITVLPSSKTLLRAQKAAALAQVIEPELQLAPVALAQDKRNVARVTQFLQTLPGDGPLAVLHPGTSAFGRFKRWPAARFGETAARLQRDLKARCVVTYGPGEEELAAQVVGSSSGAARLAPQFTLGELVELLRRASVVIGADTGPLHVAALLNRPVVAIFGPKDPSVYAPCGTRCEVVRADLPCSPCTKRRCDHVRCMECISVEDVAAAAERLLKNAASSNGQ
jgi:lipopolysaccharide heptosyltransferase I